MFNKYRQNNNSCISGKIIIPVSLLKEFKSRFPNENPIINIVQFAMVSAGTPGAINNLADILRLSGFSVPSFSYGHKKANQMAFMMGLGKIIDMQNRQSEIGLRVRSKTQHPNLNNEGSKSFGFFSPHSESRGSGISGLQQICFLNEFFLKIHHIEETLQSFLEKKYTSRAKL